MCEEHFTVLCFKCASNFIQNHVRFNQPTEKKKKLFLPEKCKQLFHNLNKCVGGLFYYKIRFLKLLGVQLKTYFNNYL